MYSIIWYISAGAGLVILAAVLYVIFRNCYREVMEQAGLKVE